VVVLAGLGLLAIGAFGRRRFLRSARWNTRLRDQ
jgi:hypothetical protein